MEKVDSTTKLPVMIPAMTGPRYVITGIRELRSACFNTRALVFTPLGYSSHNATRWLQIGGFRYQPSEFAKVLIVLFFARFLMDNEEDLNTIRKLAISAVLAAIPLLLIVREPDLSTTIVTFMMIFSMMFFAGLSY